MKAYTIPLSFSLLLLLSACASQPDEPQLLAQSKPVEIASSDELTTPNRVDEPQFIQQSQQQATSKIAQDWVGVYQSKVQVGLSTTLELNADHTAITRYEYQNGDPSLIETGFWQQQDEDKIHVLMTSHDGNNFNSLRIFTINGFQLKAKEEIVNGMEYQLGTDGLMVQKVNIK